MTAIASQRVESSRLSDEPAMKPSRIFGVEIEPGALMIKPFVYITISLLFLFASACASIAWLRVSFDSREPGVERRVKDLIIVDSFGNRLSIAERCGEAGMMLVFVDPDRTPFDARAERTLERLASRHKNSLKFWFVVSQADTISETAARLGFRWGRSFPVLFDPRQELAERTGVESLPTAALIDRSGLVMYLGPIEDQNEARFNKQVDIDSNNRIGLERIVEKFAGGSLRNPVVIAIDRAEPLDPRRTVGSKESITYEQDVEPILRSRCSGCHRPREAGPFPLLTYRDAAKRADFLRDIVVERRMPPWKPKSGFGDFLDEMRLTRHEIGVLSTWADRGAPEGARSESRSLTHGESGESTTSAEGDSRLGDPDLILKLDGSFPIPEIGDEYRAFVLPIPIDRDVAISAVEFRPDNRRVVHHARLYIDPTDESRLRDQGDSKPGFASWGGNDILKPGLGAWTPGSIARKSPPGVGSIIKKGSDLVLLIHYHGTGKREADRSSVGLFFSKTPIERTWRSVPLSTAKIDIPAGEARHRIDLSAKLPANVHAYSVLPHGHYLLREIKLWAILPDGSIRRLLWIDDWDFQWQGNYHFAVPIALPKGTELRVKAIYDNSSANPLNPSSPPRRVVFGPSSVDEMLGCHIQILPDGPDDERKIVEKWPHSL